jgi:hypothetical protein
MVTTTLSFALIDAPPRCAKIDRAIDDSRLRATAARRGNAAEWLVLWVDGPEGRSTHQAELGNSYAIGI